MTSAAPSWSLNVGSRESPLAMAQTRQVIAWLEAAHPGLACSVLPFKTLGDRFLDAPLSAIGDKGLFVKELEDALLAGHIDFAVHSAKDMLSVLPEGLTLQSVGPREDPRDVLVLPAGRGGLPPVDQSAALSDLPAGSVVGTASLRRVAQLRRLRPDLEYRTVRGNIQTRLAKLDAGDYDALVLAAAGLRRVDLTHRISRYFSLDEMLPAGSQGILALEYRAGDSRLAAALAAVADASAELALLAERAFLKMLEAGCRAPVAVHARPEGAGFVMDARVLSEDGQQLLADRCGFEATAEAACLAGSQLGERLLAQGAGALVAG